VIFFPTSKVGILCNDHHMCLYIYSVSIRLPRCWCVTVTEGSWHQRARQGWQDCTHAHHTERPSSSPGSLTEEKRQHKTEEW